MAKAQPKVDTRSRLLRMTAADFAVPVLLVGVLTSTWTGVSISDVQIVDLALAVAAVLVVADALTGRRTIPVPWWVGVGGLTVLAIATVHVFFPTSEGYMGTRYTVLFNERTVAADGSLGSILVGVRWCVALIILPVVTAYLVRTRPTLLRSIAFAFVVGAAVSSAVALSDWFGFTQIGPSLIGGPSISGRQNGLASHVNSLAFACVLAIPLAMHVFPWRRFTILLLLLVIGGGVFITGSRGGQVGAVLALLISLFFLRAARKAIVWFAVLAVGALAVVSAVAPQYFTLGATLLRFDTGTASDAGRSLVGEQALLDFGTHPIFGVGLPIITHAHSVPLQLVASGGMVLAVGITIYWVAAVVYGWRYRWVADGASAAAAVAIVLWVGQSLIQNQLVDRFLYVPIAMVAGAYVLARARSERRDPQPAPRRYGMATASSVIGTPAAESGFTK
ncbi:MAG: hypothetical protein K0S37_4337 [Microbacterium sp.]|jgi:hypothetical protein|nr:hypothetical protein [Microbacterium sp.]